MRWWFAGVLFPLSLHAQFSYTVDQSIPVEIGEAVLTNAWAGGLNAAQFNTMDLNADGQADLVIFDRTASKISTFVAANNSYTYAPEYEALFPSEISTFLVLRDFNCDGKKDLFTFGQIGVFVFRNETQAGKPLSWKKLSFFNNVTKLKSDVLLTTGFSGKINLLPGTNDLPDFQDMDGDGDLDVMNMRFVTPGTAEYHKNFSMERYGKCDSLDLERQTQNWGEFEECSCGKIAFAGVDCSQIGGRTEAIEHTGGKALLALDMDNDGDKDLLFTEESCAQIYYMENHGTTSAPILNGLSLFPLPNPVGIDIYPAPYLEDVDFDGKPDLLASTNMYARTTLSNNFKESIWFYKNNGSAQLPSFSFVKENFLQESMFDFGDFSAPALVDIDQDGDEDLFVGKYNNDNFRSTISYFENTGTALNPSFKLVSDDFLTLSFLGFYNIKPQFVDFDSNGSPDLFFTATNLINGRTSIYLIPSSGFSSFNPTGDLLVINVAIDPTENATVVDIDLDGNKDMLIGTNTGSLEYWRNTGSGNKFVLVNSQYLGLSSSPLRQNLTAVVGDLDADGYEDLLVGDQSGTLSVYGDFRSAGATPQPVKDLIYDSFSKSYGARKLGGRLRPFITHLLGSSKPEIMVGNTLGGLYLLKNDNGEALTEEPSIKIFPNPLHQGEPLSVLADRNVRMDIFTIMGQRIGTSLFVPANQALSYPLQGVAPGMYIARFTTGSKTVSKRFVIL